MNGRELVDLLPAELVASAEEGRDVEGLRAEVEEWLAQARRSLEETGELPPEMVSEGQAIYQRLVTTPIRDDFPYSEPSTWEGIVAEVPALADPQPYGTIPAGYEERVLGGWLGRAAGCLLGKPVEGWPRSRIEGYLRAARIDELVDYLPRVGDKRSEWHISFTGACKGEVNGMLRDDDLDYTVAGLMLLERHGARLTPADAGRFWLEYFPYHQVYTAERAAYRNLIDGLVPPATACRYNPYREWIGAQIRADAFGYVCPGAPGAAARLAYQDAALSHTGNGIYGEMWAAATIAAAFTARSPREAVQAGLEYVPRRSRFAEMVRDCLVWGETEATWEGAWRRLESKYGRYHPVHTLNNAGVVVLALLYGGGDLARTVGLAVRGGWDTDCNGATAGSVIGVWLGAERLSRHLVEPLHDRLRTALAGLPELRFSELAARTGKVARQLVATAAGTGAGTGGGQAG